MPVPFIQTAFTAGEISPSLFGHVDLAKSHVGAATMRNMFVSYRGGAYSRAGGAFVGFSKQTGTSYPPRLIPFQFSITQGLVLEFGDYYMRVIYQGALVTEETLPITGIDTSGTPATFTCNNFYSNGDWGYISGVQGITDASLVNGGIFKIVGVTATTFQLTDIFGNFITLVGTFTGTASVARIYTLTTPYAAVDLPYLKFTQSADVMSLCCWNQVTGTSYPTYDLKRYADTDWGLELVAPVPTIQPPTDCTATSTGTGSTDYNYCVTAISNVDGSESIASAIADLPDAIDIAVAYGTNTISWTGSANAASYNVYRALPVDSSAASGVVAGAALGYVGQSLGTQFSDTNITADFTQTPPTYTNPFAPGPIASVTVTNPGSGLTAVTYSITTAGGTGFVGLPVLVGGQLTAFIVQNTGSGYRPGDSIKINGVGYSTGGLVFYANPVPGDTITLNGAVWTFVSHVTGSQQTLIQATAPLTVAQYVADLTASGLGALTVASYQVDLVDNLAVIIVYNTAGSTGDAYTIALGPTVPVNANGPHLTGGSGTDGAAAILNVGALTGTYPSVVSYFQQRRVYASSPNNPDTYWMSQSGIFLNFDTRSPPTASDAITGTPWSVQVNGVQFMLTMPGGLVVLTGLGAWQLTGAGGSSLNPQPITPSNQQAQPQAYNGCSPTVPPVKIDYNILFVQAKGSLVRSFEYNFFTNIYTGNDLTQFSSHLFLGHTIVNWAWAEEPYKVMWVVRDDGVMLSLTYLRQQEVVGWARHDTFGSYAGVASITEPPVDAVYMAVQRTPLIAWGSGTTPGNIYYLERMDDRMWTSAEDCVCVDSCITIPMPTPDAELVASSATGLGSISAIAITAGGAGYSSGTTGTIIDSNGAGPGTGAAITSITIASGVITSVTFTPGSGYVRPSISFYDPARTGAGAVAQASLNNTTSFTASTAVFSSGDVGSTIRMGGGKALITSYISSTVVQADILIPIADTIPNSLMALGYLAVTPQAPGAWTLSPPTSTVSGLSHLEGLAVTGVADGQEIPLTTVSGGSITLDRPASYVTVGLGFTAQLQTPYLEVGAPTVQGQRKRIPAVTVRVEASVGMWSGVNQVDGSTLSPMQIAPAWSNLLPVPYGNSPPYGSLLYPLYTGDIRVPLAGGFSKPGQVAFHQPDPYPMNILAVIPDIDQGDLPQPAGPVQAQSHQQGR